MVPPGRGRGAVSTYAGGRPGRERVVSLRTQQRTGPGGPQGSPEPHLRNSSETQEIMSLATLSDDRLARMTNLVVARMFEEIAQSLEVGGEQGHRLRAYRRAAR